MMQMHGPVVTSPKGIPRAAWKPQHGHWLKPKSTVTSLQGYERQPTQISAGLGCRLHFPAAGQAFNKQRVWVGVNSAQAQAPTAPDANTKPVLPVGEHIIIEPAAGNAAPAESECMLVIAPGRGVPAESFRQWAEAIQATAPHLRLWVGVIDIDMEAVLAMYTAWLGPGAGFMQVVAALEQDRISYTFMQQLVDQAVAAGFKLSMESTYRRANVFVLGQSAGGNSYAPVAAATCGGVVLLASTLCYKYAQHMFVSLEAAGRPTMFISGELDGQMRWPWHAPYAAEASAMAAKLGMHYASRMKPFVLVQDANHGNTSNGVANVARGDITRGVAPLQETVKAAAGPIAAFLTANLSPDAGARFKAEEKLAAAVGSSMAQIATYCMALGLGNVHAPYAAGGSLADAAAGGWSPEAGPLAYAIRTNGAIESNALPAGMLIEAEVHAVRCQRALLEAAGLPREALARLRVAASAHNSVDTFLFSQPALEQQRGGGWLLHVHVLVHFRSEDGDGCMFPFQRPMAPDYTLKLKGPELVAGALGLPNPQGFSAPPPALLNRLALDLASAQLPPRVVARHQQLGRKLVCEGDWEWLAAERVRLGLALDAPLPAGPSGFVRDARIAFAHRPAQQLGPASDSNGEASASVRVASPYVATPPPAGMVEYSTATLRFAGAYYVKVMSVAQAMEWVWVDGLRDSDTPW